MLLRRATALVLYVVASTLLVVRLRVWPDPGLRFPKVKRTRLFEVEIQARGGHGRPRGGNTCDRCLRGLCSRFVVGVV